MVMLTKEELRQVQMIQLEMLEEVDRICRKCGIHYNIIAGTLLGAVRHGGYIPWDDDADVALLRNEYERFRQACRTELDKSRFYFQDHRNTRGYRWGYGKLRRKGTLFLREHQEDMPYGQGIFIDIFPLDGVPDNYLARSVKNFQCFCVRKILWSRVGKKADPSPSKRRVYQLLDRIPEEWAFRCYHRMIRQAGKRETAYVRILTFPTPNRFWGYKRAWYTRSREFLFEGKRFWGIYSYHDYLSFKFGDYMRLPGKEERKTHPVSRLKLLEREEGACEKNQPDHTCL